MDDNMKMILFGPKEFIKKFSKADLQLAIEKADRLQLYAAMDIAKRGDNIVATVNDVSLVVRQASGDRSEFHLSVDGNQIPLSKSLIEEAMNAH